MKQFNMRIAQCFLIWFAGFSPALYAAPPIEHWTTENGARVYFVAAQEIPIVDIRVVFNGGSAHDGGSPGLAQIVGQMLSEGAGQLDANAFNDRLADTGAEFSSGALRDMAWVSVRSLRDEQYLEPSLELMQLVLGAPRFDDDAIKRTKASALVRLKREAQSPAKIASKAFYRAVFGNHPYGSPVSGTKESIEALDRAEIVAFHQRYFGSLNATIAIVGALDRSSAERIANAITAKMSNGSRAASPPPVDALSAPIVERIDYPSIQSHIRIGQPGMRRGDADYFALLVGNHVLGGGGLVSILFDEVREKRGLSYSVSSRFSPMAAFGPFTASLQTDNSQQTEALSVLRAEIAKFVKNGPPPKLLDSAKQNLIGGFPLRIDSNSKIVEYLSMIGFYDLPLDYLNTFTEKVAAVNAEDVKSAFQRRVDPAKMVTIVVGKPADVAKQN